MTDASIGPLPGEVDVTVVGGPACEGFDASGPEVAVIGWGRHVPAFAMLIQTDGSRATCVEGYAAVTSRASSCSWLPQPRVRSPGSHVPSRCEGVRRARRPRTLHRTRADATHL